jgi:RNA polymerase sigma factor (sigma-70 family)
MLKLFQVTLPTPVRSLSRDEQQDFIQEFFLHCVEPNFATLRKYKNIGSSFAAWCLVVASRYALSLMKSRKYRKHVPLESSGTANGDVKDEARDIIDTLVDKNLPIDQMMVWRELKAVVLACLSELTIRQQLLLELKGDELRPREILRVMGEDPGTNKDLSEEIRQAKKKLETCVNQRLKSDKSRLRDYFSGTSKRGKEDE